MPRLAPLDLANLSAEQERVVQALLDGRIGAIRGPSDAWLRSPGLAGPALQLVEHARYDTGLPRDLVELVILLTGKHWKAQLEFWGHARMAQHHGIPGEAIEAIRTGERPQLGRPDLEAAYDLFTEYFATNRVSDATYGKALEALGERGLIELLGVSGLYGFVSMTLNIFDVGVPEGEQPPFAE
jgi:4-carboxymuconolactone decarboxylase